tara:strand:- start:262 stop:549 length:288 start_codon:yes stop_codon:yes gene_type:complete
MTGQAKFSSHNMWKLYGQSTESFLEKNSPLTLNVITTFSCIMAKGNGVFGEIISNSTKIAVFKSDLTLGVVNKSSKITGNIFKKNGISALFWFED